VHLIIGTLIGIVFSALLVKALIETTWGLCLIAYGRGLKLLAFGLRIFAKIVRFVGNNHPTAPVVEEPQRISIVHAWNLAHSQPSKQTSEPFGRSPERRNP